MHISDAAISALMCTMTLSSEESGQLKSDRSMLEASSTQHPGMKPMGPYSGVVPSGQSNNGLPPVTQSR
jgi:hypothetical protein